MFRQKLELKMHICSVKMMHNTHALLKCMGQQCGISLFYIQFHVLFETVMVYTIYFAVSGVLVFCSRNTKLISVSFVNWNGFTNNIEINFVLINFVLISIEHYTPTLWRMDVIG